MLHNKSVVGFFGSNSTEFSEVVLPCNRAAEDLNFGFLLVESTDLGIRGFSYREVSRLLECSCFVVDLGNYLSEHSLVILEVLVNSGRPIFIMSAEIEFKIPFGLTTSLVYKNSSEGYRRIFNTLKRWLRRVERPTIDSTSVVLNPDAVDIGLLEPRAFENLCFELLQRIGFQRIHWNEGRVADLMGTVRKKDPDGYEYDELWFVFLGNHVHRNIHNLNSPYFVNELIESIGPKINPKRYMNSPITILFIPNTHDQDLERYYRNKYGIRHPEYQFRLRVWENRTINALLAQNTGLIYKYFVDETNKGSHRKSYEELYRENVRLTDRLQVFVKQLQDEQQRRIIAERDAAWKDVSFKAAHKLGNPIYQADNWIAALEKHIDSKGEPFLASLKQVIEKAKLILDQFKSATKIFEVKPVLTNLRPICENALSCFRHIDGELTVVSDETICAFIDPERFEEVLDELVRNACANSKEKKIVVKINIKNIDATEIPEELLKSNKYVLLQIIDNGPGVPINEKEEIFLPFYTTNPHGTGLGLPIVRKIIEAHGGLIRENGIASKGAVFEVFLPTKID